MLFIKLKFASLSVTLKDIVMVNRFLVNTTKLWPPPEIVVLVNASLEWHASCSPNACLQWSLHCCTVWDLYRKSGMWGRGMSSSIGVAVFGTLVRYYRRKEIALTKARNELWMYVCCMYKTCSWSCVGGVKCPMRKDSLLFH